MALAHKDWECIPSDIPLVRAAGEEFDFLLEANPTKSLLPGENAEKTRGKRAGIVDAGQAESWLRRKALAGGFELLECDVDPMQGLSFTRKGQSLYFTRMFFRGRLRVTQPTIFNQTRGCGLGRGKAFGMGLLVLLPTL